MNPKEQLLEGVDILEPILAPYGFKFTSESEGPSSGGKFACGAFISGNKRLELHVRYNLGLVSYQVGNIKMQHTDFLYAQGVKGQYPGTTSTVINAFRNLAEDLKNYGKPFLNTDTTEFDKLAKYLEENPPVKGFKALL